MAPAKASARPLRILFACVGNAARSQMAQGFAAFHGGAAVEARSGGSRPAGHVEPKAIEAMREKGIDISHHHSKGFDEAWIRDHCDLVVTMGCGDDACPAFIGKPLVDWALPDPKGHDVAFFRQVRDDIEGRMRRLFAERGITWATPAPAPAAAAGRSRPAAASDREAVLALLRDNKLEADFVASEFRVLEDGRGLAACGRMKRLPDGGAELASVAVRADLRGQGLGDRITRDLLEGSRGPTYALALAPGFFARHGFQPVDTAALPPSLSAKATGMCASTGFVAMRRPAHP